MTTELWAWPPTTTTWTPDSGEDPLVVVTSSQGVTGVGMTMTWCATVSVCPEPSSVTVTV